MKSERYEWWAFGFLICEKMFKDEPFTKQICDELGLESQEE